MLTTAFSAKELVPSSLAVGAAFTALSVFAYVLAGFAIVHSEGFISLALFGPAFAATMFSAYLGSSAPIMVLVAVLTHFLYMFVLVFLVRVGSGWVRQRLAGKPHVL